MENVPEAQNLAKKHKLAVGTIDSWLKDNVKLIDSPSETEELAKKANPNDRTYFVPAFSV